LGGRLASPVQLALTETCDGKVFKEIRRK